MTNLSATRLPERLSLQSNHYRRILQRQIPGQQAFGIYRGVPTFKAGEVIENLILISEDQRFVSMGSCWKSLLREMEKEQGRLRFLRDKGLLSPHSEDPLRKIRAAT